MKYFMSLMVLMTLTTTALAADEQAATRMCNERMPKVTNMQEAMTVILDRKVKEDLISMINLAYIRSDIILNTETDIKINYKFDEYGVVITGTVAAGENSIDFNSDSIFLVGYSMEMKGQFLTQYNPIGQITKQTLNCNLAIRDSDRSLLSSLERSAKTIHFENSATGGGLGYLQSVDLRGMLISFPIK